jgi:tetratricopeptide (TPR) repeat protein
MSAIGRDIERQVIPRWRGVLATVRHRELGASGKLLNAPSIADSDVEALSDRAREFREHRSLSFAADLLSASIVVGVTPDTRAAAELVIAADSSPLMLTRTAEWIVQRAEDSYGVAVAQADPEEPQQDIARLRRGLRANPRNAVRWAELARSYVNEGHEKKAVSAIRIALNMAPYDRYILRGAVRLWLHYGKPNEAVRTLRHARDTVLADPWLLATEIATSAEAKLTSRNIRRGREMVDGAFHAPVALSELTSALATLELDAGATRKARKLFQAALVDPNENSVAQAEWASGRIQGLDVGDRVEQSAEARARRFADHNVPDETLASTHEWLVDQPFSSEPAIFGSYHASMHARFDEGAKFARAGLRPNPGNALLMNNLAFCQANMGDLEGAMATLGAVDVSAEEEWVHPTLKATNGFVAFRSHEIERGRALYVQAIEAMPAGVSRLRAQLMLASEDARTGAPHGGEALAAAFEAIAKLSDPEVVSWARNIVEAKRSPARRPER